MLQVDTQYFKTILGQRKISGRAFAKRLGIDPSALSRTLRIKREMKAEEAAKIAAYLGISLDDVLRHAGIREGAKIENTVRVTGRLTGTGEIEIIGESRKPETVPAPPDVPPGSTAIVADTARSPLELMDGWTFFIGPKVDHPNELLGRQVVALVVGETKARLGWLKRSHRAAHFNVISDGGTTLKAVQIEWAAPVIWIKP